MEEIMPWIRLNTNGEFSNAHTGDPVTFEDANQGTILRAIKGYAGDFPERKHFVFLGADRFLEISKSHAQTFPVLSPQELYEKARAVTNNGFAFFSTFGVIELDYEQEF